MMDSQTLPLPVGSHQLALHRMSHFDMNPRAPSWIDRRQTSSSAHHASISNGYKSYPSVSHIATQNQSPTPSSRTNTATKPQRQNSASSTDSTLPSLRMPPEISENGGSLAEFAAQITCLFWFETTETLRIAEAPIAPDLSIKPLARDALPGTGFQKWVVTILTTTQVTQNVILLALLFIYRLKMINPRVKGKVGSEYRLLTVALMLGNKFLDDNTYTNKTWAEVSGIAVGEIHVMEVEFLSNMRYSLFASQDQWKRWKSQLRNFANYFNRASSQASLPSPGPGSGPGFNPAVLPSPPMPSQSSPSRQQAYSKLNSNVITNGHSYSQHSCNPDPALPSMPELNLRPTSRKRSYDGTSDDPPAKRVVYQPPISTPALTPGSSTNRQNLPRLPIPNLTISTREPMHPVSGNYSTQNGPVLPPLSGSVNGRAMSTVYPTTPSSYASQQVLLTPTGTINSAFGTPSRHQSPHPFQDILSVGSSPTAPNFPRNALNHNSPSFFLQQRSSPYKPVRTVHTLLHPPPQMAMQGLPRVGQMHYQPLGKRNDYRSGIVPDYQYHPAYNRENIAYGAR